MLACLHTVSIGRSSAILIIMQVGRLLWTWILAQDCNRYSKQTVQACRTWSNDSWDTYLLIWFVARRYWSDQRLVLQLDGDLDHPVWQACLQEPCVQRHGAGRGREKDVQEPQELPCELSSLAADQRAYANYHEYDFALLFENTGNPDREIWALWASQG